MSQERAEQCERMGRSTLTLLAGLTRARPSPIARSAISRSRRTCAASKLSACTFDCLSSTSGTWSRSRFTMSRWRRSSPRESPMAPARQQSMLAHPDVRRTPRVSAFIDSVVEEIETLRPILTGLWRGCIKPGAGRGAARSCAGFARAPTSTTSSRSARAAAPEPDGAADQGRTPARSGRPAAHGSRQLDLTLTKETSPWIDCFGAPRSRRFFRRWPRAAAAVRRRPKPRHLPLATATGRRRP